jgi:hypothetical protein
VTSSAATRKPAKSNAPSPSSKKPAASNAQPSPTAVAAHPKPGSQPPRHEPHNVCSRRKQKPRGISQIG